MQVPSGWNLIKLFICVGRWYTFIVNPFGDRGTGKTAIFLFSLIASKLGNLLSSPEGFGAKRVWGIYVGVCIVGGGIK